MEKIKMRFELPANEIATIVASHLGEMLKGMGKNMDVDFSFDWEVIAFKNGDKTEHMVKGATIQFVEKKERVEHRPPDISEAKPKEVEGGKESAPVTGGA